MPNIYLWADAQNVDLKNTGNCIFFGNKEINSINTVRIRNNFDYKKKMYFLKWDDCFSGHDRVRTTSERFSVRVRPLSDVTGLFVEGGCRASVAGGHFGMAKTQRTLMTSLQVEEPAGQLGDMQWVG